MGAKIISVAPQGTTNWTIIPGSDGKLGINSDTVDDTIFGQKFKSENPNLLSWTVSTGAKVKGVVGYTAVIKKTGSPIAFTGEAMSNTSGQTYRIDNTAKNIWDITTPVVVYDNGIDATTSVSSINFLFGEVTFDSAYTVTGPVTVDGASLPNSQICSITDFSLTQQAATNDTTDFCVSQSNNGHKTYEYGLKTVSISANGFHSASNTFVTSLTSRERVVIEINPDGNGLSSCRGFFKPTSYDQSGNVGDLEKISINYMLNVPDDNQKLSFPFAWEHSSTSTLNQAIRDSLDAWENDQSVEIRYLSDGTSGHQGTALVTDVSLKSDVKDLNSFTLNFQGTGSLATI